MKPISNRRIRVGIVSFAHLHADAYVPILKKLSDVALVGMADDDHERAIHCADRFDLRLFASTKELLASDLDAALICSENKKHHDDVVRAAEAGCAILCEKPLAPTSQEATSMVAACKRSAVPLMTAFPMRFSAPVVALRAQLAQVGAAVSSAVAPPTAANYPAIRGLGLLTPCWPVAAR